MYDAEALGAEILWRHWNDDKVRGDESVPAAFVQIRRTIKQDDVEATRRLEFFQKCAQHVLLHPKILGARLVVLIQALVGSYYGQTGDSRWNDQ
jgi:hypothetical protein